MRPLLLLILTACAGEKPTPTTETPAEPTTPAEPVTPTAPKAIEGAAVPVTSLPAGLGLTGDPVSATGWTDSDGENLLVLTTVAEHPARADEPDLRDAELYGYQLTKKDGAWQQAWKIQDFVRTCPNDILARHLTESVTITDLDSDGQAESAWIYRTACRGDVSPATQKLMMHEGATKYAIRGEAKISAGTETVGGSSTPDPAFNTAPPAFLSAAQALWTRYEVETF